MWLVAQLSNAATLLVCKVNCGRERENYTPRHSCSFACHWAAMSVPCVQLQAIKWHHLCWDPCFLTTVMGHRCSYERVHFRTMETYRKPHPHYCMSPQHGDHTSLLFQRLYYFDSSCGASLHSVIESLWWYSGDGLKIIIFNELYSPSREIAGAAVEVWGSVVEVLGAVAALNGRQQSEQKVMVDGGAVQVWKWVKFQLSPTPKLLPGGKFS